MKSFFCILICVVLLGCSDSTRYLGDTWIPSSEAKYLHLSHSNLEYSAENDLIKTINIESISTPWEIIGEMQWVQFSQLNGNADATIDVQTSVNTDPKTSRSAIYQFSSIDKDFPYTKNITINQQAAKYKLTLSQTIIDAPASISSYSIVVNANADWTASTEYDWIQLSSIDNQLKVELTENTTSTNSDRTGNIIVQCGNTSANITINQEPPFVSAKTDTLKFDSEGGTFQLTVSSDVSWKAKSSQSWINVYPTTNNADDNQLYISVVPNNTIDKRLGNVYVCIDDNEIVKVPVFQDALYLGIDKQNITIGKEGGSEYVTVNTNTNWSIISKPAFLSSSSPSSGGKGQTRIMFTFDENSGGDKSGKIIIGNSSITGLTKTINVSQEGYELSASETSINIPATSDLQHEITLTTNDKWQTNASTSWLHSTPSFGIGNGVITIIADRNGMTRERTGQINIQPNSELPAVVVNILQQGRHISATADSLFFTSAGGTYDIIVDTSGDKITTNTTAWLTVKDVDVLSAQQFKIKVSAPEYYGDSIRETTLDILLEEKDGDDACKITIPVIQFPPVQTIGIVKFDKDNDWNISGDNNGIINITGFNSDINWNFK